MPQQFNSLPTYEVSLIQGNKTAAPWYFFWQGLFKGLAPAAVAPITVAASPYTYTAPVKGFVLLTGGTVSLVEFSRDGTTFYNCGETAGQFALNAADRLRVTYTVAPTLNFVPT
jgi:hypothetical protein